MKTAGTEVHGADVAEATESRTCQKCGGTGLSGPHKICGSCMGYGFISQKKVACHRCKGTGFSGSHVVCDVCRGVGYLPVR